MGLVLYCTRAWSAQIKAGREEWTVNRRYSQFKSLHTDLLERFKEVSLCVHVSCNTVLHFTHTHTHTHTHARTHCTHLFLLHV